MRIEHTSGSESRPTVLKTVQDTSPNSLPIFLHCHSSAGSLMALRERAGFGERGVRFQLHIVVSGSQLEAP